MTTDASGIAVIHEMTVPVHEREAPASPYTTEKPMAALRAKYRRVRTAGLLGGGFMT
ncbi:hypothetical protein ACFYPC_05155 [Streptomyces sp. NPDC005808]|uniref:hypothetical protein n=1 Tax=Streptomyces sp. NPDC005808 TaxID=3364734 RepID=UPI0036CE8096